MSATHEGNNFDFLRFTAATMVWYFHCYALYGEGPDPLSRVIPFQSFGSLGVLIFFVISGYFVTQSYTQRNRLTTYLKNRALRIFPALIAVVLLSTFVLGPLTTSLPIREYFYHPETWRSLKSILIFPVQYDLPGVFTHLSSPHVNGSLWTLQHEARCYIVVALLGVLGILRPRVGLLVFAALWFGRIYGSFAYNDMAPHIALFDRWSWGKLELPIELGILFASGGLLFLMKDRIAPSMMGFFVAFLLIVASVFIHHAHPITQPGGGPGAMLFDLVFPYIIICVGFAKLPVLSHFGKFGDFSYGMYLYAFPLQNLTLVMFPHIGFQYFMGLSFVMTFICAVLSWHLVEKPALARKR